MQTDLKRLFRHSGVYLVGNLFNRLGAFLLLPVYTGYLSVDEYGRLELLYSLSAVISVICSAGLAHSTLRFYFDRKLERERHRAIATGLTVVTVSICIGAAAVYMVRAPVASWLLDDAAYATAISLTLAILVLELTTEVGFAFLRAREQSVFFVLLSVTRLLVQVALSFYLVVMRDEGMLGVLQANLISIFVIWTIVVGYTVRHCGVGVDTTLLPAMLRYSAPLALGSVVASLIASIDRFLLKELLSLDAVGLYGLAMKFAVLLVFLVVEPFTRGYGPFRFSIMDQPNAPQIQAQAAHYMFVLAVVAGVGVAMVTPETLLLMSAPAYFSAHYLVPLLAVGMAVGGLGYCYETGILYRKRTSMLLYVNLAVLALKTLANVALIPLWGTAGAALAFIVGQVTYAGLVLRVSQRLYPIPYQLAPLLRVLLLGAAAYSASLFIDYRVVWWSLPIKLSWFLVFCLAVCRFDPQCRALVGGWLAGRGGPAFRRFARACLPAEK